MCALYLLSSGKKYMLYLSKLLFCFFQGDTILVGGERVASTPQGSVRVCACMCVREKVVCVCPCTYVCKREKVVCLCLCVHVCVCYGPLAVDSNYVSCPLPLP